MNPRLEKQLSFLREVDRLKTVLRQTRILDGSRRENSAEHSWHLSLMALVLVEHSSVPDLDLSRVVKMLLVHDLVEIDAGDTFLYDDRGNADKAERERRAADRLFGILDPDQALSLRNAWEEFEARQSPEARFAAALDRLQPMMHNFYTQGAAWKEHGVRAEQVLERNAHMAQGAPLLWEKAQEWVSVAKEKGWLKP